MKNEIALVCKVCGKGGDIHSHHIIPKSRGGNDHLSNLILLCVECHGKAHDVSFKGEKGLIKSGITKVKQDIIGATIWVETNHTQIMKAFIQLSQEDHNTLFTLMEVGCIDVLALKKICRGEIPKLSIPKELGYLFSTVNCAFEKEMLNG